MIIAAKSGEKTLYLRRKGRPNIFPIDSAALIIGPPGSGKTAFLEGIVDNLLGRTGPVDIALSFSASSAFNAYDWRVFHYTSCRYAEPLPPHKALIEQTKAPQCYAELLDAHAETLSSFGIDSSIPLHQQSSSKRGLLDFLCAVKHAMLTAAGSPQIVLLLDDADAGMHLVWQCKFINEVLKLLAKCKELHNIQVVQAVFSTNSHVILSDFTRDFVCRLHADYWNGAEDPGKDFTPFAGLVYDTCCDAMGAGTLPAFACSLVNQVNANIDNAQLTGFDSYVMSQIGDCGIANALKRKCSERGLEI